MQIPPQGFAQYPRPQGLPSGVQSLPPGAHIEAIGEAWRLFQQQWSTWVGASVIAVVIYIGLYIPSVFLNNTLMYGQTAFFPTPGSLPSFAGLGEAMLLGLIPAAINVGLGGGMIRMALKQLRGDTIAVSDVFSAFGKIPQLMGAYICCGILVMVGMVLCIIPGFWVQGAFSLTPFPILDQDKGVFESMGMSFGSAGSAGTGFSMFGLLFLLSLIFMAGFIGCFVGALVTFPLFIIAYTIHYFYFFPEAFATAPIGNASPSAPPMYGR